MFERFKESLKHEPRQDIHMEKPLYTVWVPTWVGPKFRWGRASENHQGRANSVSQVDAVSDMVVPACLYVREGLFKEQWLLPSLPLGES